MQFLALIVGAVLAFSAGVWYANEYDFSLPYVNSPKETPQQNGNTTLQPQATYHNATADKIVVTTPLPGATVGNTFIVSGKARGGWYFEASFPIEVIDTSGMQIFLAPVQAQGEWMTAEFVPFTAQVSVPASYKGPATLVLRNDNPSGLLQNEASISIPITIQ